MKRRNRNADAAMKALLQVQLAGALLEVIAERVATGRIGSPLRTVIEEAMHRAELAPWRMALKGGF